MDASTRERLPRAMVRGSLAWPMSTVLTWFGTVLLLAPGLFLLTVETSAGSILASAGESWANYEDLVRTYGSDEVITVVFEGSEEFDREALDGVALLTSRLSRHPDVERVDSVSSIPRLVGGAMGHVSMTPFYDSAGGDWRTELADALKSSTVAENWLVSRDRRTFAAHVHVRQVDDQSYVRVITAVKDIAPERPMSGVPMFRVAADEYMRREVFLFAPIALGLLVVFVWLNFRSWKFVGIAVAPGMAGALIVYSVMGVLEIPITISTVVLPSILLALGCAYSMHMACNVVSRDASVTVDEALLAVAFPVLLSGTTTTIGFLGISLVDIPAIGRLGAYGALGAAIVTLATLTLVPAWASIVKVPRSRAKGPEWAGGFAVAFAEFGAKRRTAVLLAGIVVSCVAIVGIERIVISTDVVSWFPRESRLRQDYEKIRDSIAGISPLSIVVSPDDPSMTVSESEVLRAIQELTAFLDQMSMVGNATSVVDFMRSLRVALGLGDVPGGAESRAQMDQLLWLLEAHHGTGALVASNRGQARVIVNVNDNSSRGLLDVAEAVDSWWAQNGTPGFNVHVSGIMHEFAVAEDAIARGQIAGFMFAFCAIGAFVFLAIGATWISVGAITASLLPVGVILGMMGILSIPLDASTAVFSCLVIGIGVDDAIHIAYRLQAVRTSTIGAEGAAASMRLIFRTVGRPVVLSSAALMLGFGSLLASAFAPIRALGGVTVVGIVVFLVSDLVLYPAIVTRDGDLRRKGLTSRAP